MTQRYLIIDDARISRLRLRAALEALGTCEVVEVPNLSRAREALAAGPWSGVFCDLLLPDGDGFSLLESLPSDGPARFVYSCRVNAETRDRAKTLGADFLEKPLQDETLATLLRPLVAA
ncbi:MAG: response regulator [Planctomycetes bacterium]|nr:response regulator [Planctomycetota bacterium]